MSALLPVLVLLLGCPPKAPAPPSGPPLVIGGPEPEVLAQGAEVGPGRWTDPGGVLVIDVPEGWAGREGPTSSSLVVTLDHAASGVEVQVWQYAGSGRVEPRPRPGCEWMFTDEGRHRLVPALEPAITATCLGEDPRAPVVQGWYGLLRGREIHVEVIYPAGRIIEGRAVVEPLLRGLGTVGPER